jgi:hypothetical protein
MNGRGIQQRTGFAELSQRESDGIEVQLLWEQSTGRVLVVVFDAKSGTELEVPAKADEALEVFWHPFAYAARRSDPRSLADVGALIAV